MTCFHKKITSVIFLFLWSGMIFYFSSWPNLNLGSGIIPLEIIARKFAHLGEYFVLAVIFWNFLKINFPSQRKNFFLYAILFILAFAVSDEIHQTFVISRSGRIEDVIFDLGSGMLGLLVIKSFKKREKDKR